VGRLLRDAAIDREPLLVSVANWGEVFYLSRQRVGEERARQALGKLSRFFISVVPVDLPQALKAGEIKALHHIPYVDCLAAALAILNQATLVTSDRDFEKLGRKFPVLWLPRR
jgi:predicted nucleic acid-binding protein